MTDSWKEDVKALLLSAAKKGDNQRIAFLLPLAAQDATFVNLLKATLTEHKHLDILETIDPSLGVKHAAFDQSPLMLALLSAEELKPVVASSQDNLYLKHLHQALLADATYDQTFSHLEQWSVVWAEHVLRRALLFSDFPFEAIDKQALLIADAITKSSKTERVQGTTVINRVCFWAIMHQRKDVALTLLNHPLLDFTDYNIAQVATACEESFYFEVIVSLPDERVKKFPEIDTWHHQEKGKENEALGRKFLAGLTLVTEGRYEAEALIASMQTYSECLPSDIFFTLCNALYPSTYTAQENNEHYTASSCEGCVEAMVFFLINRQMDFDALLASKEGREALLLYSPLAAVKLTLAFLPREKWPDFTGLLEEAKTAAEVSEWQQDAVKYIETLSILQQNNILETSKEMQELLALNVAAHPSDLSQKNASPVDQLHTAFQMLKINVRGMEGKSNPYVLAYTTKDPHAEGKTL